MYSKLSIQNWVGVRVVKEKGSRSFGASLAGSNPVPPKIFFHFCNPITIKMCDNPSQELSNGFCFDKCPNGWQAFGGMCLKSCPTGFVDHGTTCEPPSLLRKPINAYLSACPDGQIDQNGNCFEPQTTTYVTLNGVQVPRVTGCNCIKRTNSQRLQCTSGFTPFNNGCISKCPSGYVDIRDSTGEISSMYCQELCPLKTNSKNVRWPHINGQCVKEYKSRTTQVNSSLSSTGVGKNSTPRLGKPVTVASELAKRPLGSSLNDRYRAAQSIYRDLGSSPATNPIQNAFGDSWSSLFEDPSKLILFFIVVAVILFAGPSLLPLLGKGVGYVLKGLGLLAGKVEGGVGTAAGALVGSAGTVVAGVTTAVGKNVSAAIARPGAIVAAKNDAEGLKQEALGIQQVTNAQIQQANAILYRARLEAKAASEAAASGGLPQQGPVLSDVLSPTD